MLVKLEQLGDLKLYRVPERTTLKSRQIKQVRLLDRQNIPVELFYGADMPANANVAPTGRTRERSEPGTIPNIIWDCPCPPARLRASWRAMTRPCCSIRSICDDTAVDEEIELRVGTSPDVQIEATVGKNERVHPPAVSARHLRFTICVGGQREPELKSTTQPLRTFKFELRLQLPDGTQLIAADATPATRNGRQVFKLPVPANRTATVRYQTEHISLRPAVR